LQARYDEHLRKHMILEDSYNELKAQYAALQKDCDDLLADKQPRRAT
jgi:hypothetical protein